LLFPEIPLDQKAFLARVKETVDSQGFCVIGVSEGIRHQDGKFLSDSGLRDAFGHAQLGGVAPVIANLIRSELGYKYHWAVADYLQRAARHLASKTDVRQAYAMGKAAVELAVKGHNAFMPIIERVSDRPYKWKVGQVALSQVANQERMMPRDFISPDGFHITAKCRRYLAPLIEGEDYPPYRNGLPDYVRLKLSSVKKKLNTAFKPS
jgi:6-phosphofructokinase 1